MDKQAPLFITRRATQSIVSAEQPRANKKEKKRNKCKQPVGRHAEHGPLVHLLAHVDVVLTRDLDLLRLVLEKLDVVVDVENVLVEGGEVVQLRERGGGSQREGGRAGSTLLLLLLLCGSAHLLPDGELQALHRLFLVQAVQVLVQVLLPPGRVRHKVIVLAQEDHGLLPHAEEDHFLFGEKTVKHQGKERRKRARATSSH